MRFQTSQIRKKICQALLFQQMMALKFKTRAVSLIKPSLDKIY